MHNILSRISRLQNNSTVFWIKVIISELFKGLYLSILNFTFYVHLHVHVLY
jgi:hypothetical protein